MIVVGANLGEDRILRLGRLVPGSVLRARDVLTAPGGKAVNVARAVLALGGRPTLVANCPGPLGAALAGALVAAGLDVVAVPSDGDLRVATFVIEDGGRTTIVNEPGPALDAAASAVFVEAYAQVLAARRPAVVVVSGSLPPGAPPGLYAELAVLAMARGATAVVDAGGPALAAAVAAGASLVKPNLAEAESVLRSLAGSGAGDEVVEAVDDAAGDVPARCVAAAEELVRAGAGAALVSGGRAGAAVHAVGGSWWLAAPVVETVNPIGAGDALAAGVAVALEAGEVLPDAVRLGIAAAADSVGRLGPGAVDAAAVARLRDSVRVRASAELTA